MKDVPNISRIFLLLISTLSVFRSQYISIFSRQSSGVKTPAVMIGEQYPKQTFLLREKTVRELVNKWSEENKLTRTEISVPANEKQQFHEWKSK